MKSVIRNLYFVILTTVALLIISIPVFMDYFAHNSCRMFGAILNESELNKTLKNDLASFVNQENVRVKLQEIGVERTMRARDFGEPFPWSKVFNHFTIDEQQLLFVVRIDNKSEFIPPYRISEVGVYYGRAWLIYANENENQYIEGVGKAQLGDKPHIDCRVRD